MTTDAVVYTCIPIKANMHILQQHIHNAKPEDSTARKKFEVSWCMEHARLTKQRFR